MMLKYEPASNTDEPGAVDYIGTYKRVQAKISLPDNTEPQIVLGRIPPKGSGSDDLHWAPMQLMAWTDNGTEVHVIEAWLYRGDRLWLINEDGSTINRLF